MFSHGKPIQEPTLEYVHLNTAFGLTLKGTLQAKKKQDDGCL